MPLIRFHDDLGIANIGATLSVPRARTDINYQLIDNFSWKRARHDLKFGYEFRRTTISQFFDAGYRGRLDFEEPAVSRQFYSVTRIRKKESRIIWVGRALRLH